MLQDLVNNAPSFLLVAARCAALIMTVPLLSTRAVSRVAKIALAGYIAFIAYPIAFNDLWQTEQYKIAEGLFNGAFSLQYLMLLIGEVMIGVITGFYVSIIFAAFSSAGQFFTFQMGFGASEVYDSLSQVENPLMGQYLNLIAMIVFIQVKGFQNLFLGGIFRSFGTINAFTLVNHRDQFLSFMLTSLSSLFFDAMLIALPMVGTLFLVTVTMGILSKAAPQMNLLSEGLPITIITAFFLLTLILPHMVDFFIQSFDRAFIKLENLFALTGTVQL
ncbi:MAG TPA: flagellar biosynthetic protein FliR [Treponemataceae bacterium]|jgi:flagellar biosynthetic protein FliR|nr:flagellar biosynthetic protein FliR [Treponemataceae bacterium]HQL03858.1 flagellar biosynthetic protein FliR [Treponemataceae bacterium]